MTGDRATGSSPDAVLLLWEAVELLNDRPCFALRRDPGRTSHALAAAIERFLDDLRIRNDAILSVLPDLTSRIYLAHRDDGQSYDTIAASLGLSAAESKAGSPMRSSHLPASAASSPALTAPDESGQQSPPLIPGRPRIAANPKIPNPLSRTGQAGKARP